MRKESEQEPGCSLGEKFFRPEECLLYNPTGKIARQPGQIVGPLTFPFKAQSPCCSRTPAHACGLRGDTATPSPSPYRRVSVVTTALRLPPLPLSPQMLSSRSA